MPKNPGREAIKLAAIFAVLAVTGCADAFASKSPAMEQGPVGIGDGINEHKGTPCACFPIPMSVSGTMPA
ncbi:MAG: hypothetical protein OXD29_03730 [Roseovarius sp.]|nr:hypothetical protein [Roseovarius sp.]MCY4207048.1 hypothetical protein [Roseovarius sp.]MCY4292371.1 hypothetical protein [Roseovarius sp.]